MNKNEAIQLLEKQKVKLATVTEDNHSNWLLQTISLVKDIMGPESVEYEHIKDFSFYDVKKKKGNDIRAFGVLEPEYEYTYKEERKAVINDFLQICIETVKAKGVYRPPKRNFLTNMDQSALAGWSAIIFAVLGTGSFGLGYGVGTRSNDVQNIRLTDENQKRADSLAYLKETIIENGLVAYPSWDSLAEKRAVTVEDTISRRSDSAK